MVTTEQKPLVIEGLDLEKVEELLGASSSEPLPVGFSRLRLKKIVIQGFKSFSQKSQVDLTEGITAIVGPNGCGKSNIVDAIRWVLGEPNARNLRADAMQDVLFAGAQDQPSSNMAEVSLEFEGSFIDKPLIYDTFEVTRRLFRTGESEYRINQKMARLKDIHQLFADTGVGRNTFAIFEQGKIEQMVAMSYAQRRLIIEEAAGISGYKAMKKQALVKWEGIEETIKQLESTHELLLERRERLQTQAQRALAYKKLQEEIKGLEKAQLALQWHDADDQLQKIALDLKKTQNLLSELQEQSVKMLERCESEEKAYQAQELQVKPSQEAMMKDKEELLALEYERKSLIEMHLEATRRSKEIQEQLTKAKQKQLQLEQALAYLQSDIERWNAQQPAQEEEKRTLDQALETLKSKLDGARSQFQQSEQAQTQASHQVALIQKELAGHTSRVQWLEDRYLRDTKEIERERQSLASLQAGASQIENQRQGYVTSLEQERQLLQTLKPQLERLDSQVQELEAIYGQLQLEREKVRLDYQWVKDTCQDRSSLSEALVWLEKLPDGDSLKKSILPLYEMLKEVTGQRLEHLRFLDQVAIAHDLQAAKAYIQRLAAAKITHFSVLVASDLLGQEVSPWPRIGQSLHDKLFALMPQIEDLSLSLEEGSSKLYQRWVKLEDQWLRLDPAAILWSQPQRQSALEIHSRLRPLESKLEALSERHRLAKLELERAKNERSSLQMKVTQAEKNEQKAQALLGELQARLMAQKESLERDWPRLEEKKKALEPQAKQMSEAKEQLDSLKRQFEEAKKQLESRSSEFLTLRQSFHGLKEQHRQMEEKGRLWNQQHQQHALRHQQKLTEVKFSKDQFEQQGFLIEELQNKQLEESSSVQQLQAKLEGCEKNLVPASEKALASRQSHDALVQSLRERQVELEQTRRKQLQGQNEKSALEMSQQTLLNKQEKLLWQRGRYEQEMEERFGQAIDMFELEPVSISQLGQRLKNLKKELEEFGEVNFAAMRELEELDSRKGLLDAQLVDIRASAQEVMRILAGLDEKCKKQFSETFKRVNEAFSHNFQLLFEGGEAKLSLTSGPREEFDEDSAGVEVVACPPGKQLKSMMLMSGGEKCLTSVALMMALFEVRPAPFCLLDEIDAPLDDANVDRFLRLLRHYSHQTQVFIITHNKKTMAVAQTLLGVSMPKRGVSKIFMLDVESKTMRV